MADPVNNAPAPSSVEDDVSAELLQDSEVLGQLVGMFMLPSILKQNARFRESLKEE